MAKWTKVNIPVSSFPKAVQDHVREVTEKVRGSCDRVQGLVDIEKHFAFFVEIDGDRYDVFHVFDPVSQRIWSVIFRSRADESFCMTIARDRLTPESAVYEIRDWLESEDELNREVM